MYTTSTCIRVLLYAALPCRDPFGDCHLCIKDRWFFANHGFCSASPIKSLRESLPRRSQSPFVPLLATVPRDGDRSTESAKQPARPRRLPLGVGNVLKHWAHQEKFNHLRLSGGISRSTLAKANENRDCRIYADYA